LNDWVDCSNNAVKKATVPAKADIKNSIFGSFFKQQTFFMKLLKPVITLLCIVILYCGCQKNDPQANSTPEITFNRLNSLTIYSPENVVINNSRNPSTATESLTPNIGGPTTIYEGYTKTYSCTSNSWTYVYSWSITEPGETPSGTGELIIGTYSQSASFTVIGTQTGQPGGTKYFIQYTLAGVPNNANYCNSTTLQEEISFQYTMPGIGIQPPRTITGSASNSESADPNVYETYPDVVGGYFSNGNGTFEIEVAPGVLVCSSQCHVSALGFPPTVTFYYHLLGSSSPWSTYSQAGNDLNGFNVQVGQAGTYEYYTQEDTAPGVLSGEIDYGTIAVQ
jgi:hypothetical protein